MLFDFDPRAARVAKSLREDPLNWRQPTRYNVVHTSGVSVWVANDAYGIGIGVGDAGPDDGGLNAYSKRRVWNAFKHWRANINTPDSILALLDQPADADDALVAQVREAGQ